MALPVEILIGEAVILPTAKKATAKIAPKPSLGIGRGHKQTAVLLLMRT